MKSNSFSRSDYFLVNPFSDVRRRYLREAEGGFHAWNGSELPEELSEPLRISESKKECASGVASGDRSAIVRCGREYYKLKACCPSFFVDNGKKVCHDRAGFDDKEPFGVMEESAAIRELDFTHRLAKRLKSYGLLPPLESVGRYEYDISFKGRPVNCAVMLTRGDARLNDVYSGSFKSYEEPDGKLKAARWMGFSERVMRECGVRWDIESVHMGNMVIYVADRRSFNLKTDSSFRKCGIAPLDFEYALNRERTPTQRYTVRHLLFDRGWHARSNRILRAYYEGLDSDSHPEFLDLRRNLRWPS